MIVRMEPKHVDQVVLAHQASFPGFFLTFLGARFLGLYYRGVCLAEEGIGFVFLNETGGVAGFVAGSSNPRGFYKRLLKRDWLRFCLASVGAICRKPGVIPRIARAFTHPSGNPVGADVAGLFSLGVLPELQGRGAGKALVAMFLDEARRRGCGKVFLTTDRDNNEATNRFYLCLGFAADRQFVTPEGRRMNEYWITL